MLILCLAGAPFAVAAAPGAFTNPAAFAAAVPAGTTAVDFDAIADGTVVSGTTQTPSGAAAGIVLPGALADVLDPGGAPLPLRVVANAGDNPASSGANTLGVEDAGNFHAVTAGSTLLFSFTAPVDAFALTLITPEEPGGALFDGDAELLVSGEATASLALADGQLLGSFGGRDYRAYFLGVVGGSPFSAATLDFGGMTPDSAFFFNLDDLVVPLPEPGGNVALLAGAALLGLLRRRADRKGRAR